MWSLFPQTSSSNLNNNLYLPSSEAASGIRGPGSGQGGQTRSRGRPRSPGSLGAPRSAPRSRAPAAARGPEGLTRGGNRRGAGGWARARPLAAPRVACLPAPAPVHGGPGAPRYLGSDPAGRSPRRCHSALCETDTQPQLGTIAGQRRPTPGLLPPPQSPGKAERRGGQRTPGAESEGGKRVYLVFGGSSESGRGRSPPY